MEQREIKSLVETKNYLIGYAGLMLRDIVPLKVALEELKINIPLQKLPLVCINKIN